MSVLEQTLFSTSVELYETDSRLMPAIINTSQTGVSKTPNKMATPLFFTFNAMNPIKVDTSVRTPKLRKSEYVLCANAFRLPGSL